MHVMIGTPQGVRVERIWINSVVATDVTEANDEAGWIIRYATEEEIERLVRHPGLIWPRDHDVLIQEHGNVRIEMRDGE